jgi:hypothetical protein
MAAQIKRMNWMRNRSAWEQHQAWQKQRQANRQIYERSSAAAIASFGGAFSGQINGVGELAIQMAAKRIQAATDAKAQELQKQLQQSQQSLDATV